MNRVTHFEIYTDDPETVQPLGINGGMTRPREGQSAGTINTVAVHSLDQTIKKIEQSGGKICVPRMAIPKVGWLAYANAK